MKQEPLFEIFNPCKCIKRPIELTPRGEIIYFKLNNATITSLDSGVSTRVGIFSGKTGALKCNDKL